MSVLVMFTVFLAREILEVRRQDTFIDSVTHELKSPLASIKLCLQTLEREGVPEDKRVTLRRMMHDDVDRLSSFIDDVLQASRLAHDDVGMDVGPVELAPIAQRAAETVTTRHRIDASAVKIEIPEGTSALGDHAALEIVVRNLIDNAVKYSLAPVDVRVSARIEGKRVLLEVKDQGIGIPQRDLKRVFARFYRVPEEGVRKKKGTGLGLFVVSALVRNMGGRVEAESQGRDKGTTMRVSLPRQAARPSVVEGEERAA
jgi:signal transduction histidine kinase